MRVALIIVHYRAGRLCFEAARTFVQDALRAGLGRDEMDIVVVDNGRDECDVEHLLTLDGQVLEPGRNLGYAAGLNFGIQHTEAELLVLSNPDVVYLPGSVGALLDALRAGAHVTGPRSFWDRKSGILHPPLPPRNLVAELARLGARLHPRLSYRVRRAYRRHLFRHWTATRPFRSYSLPGSVLAMTRQAWSAAGGFDERYALYFEDDAFMAEAEKLGLNCMHVPQAEVLHLLNRSAASESAAGDWFEQSQHAYRLHQFGSVGARAIHQIDQFTASHSIRSEHPVCNDSPSIAIDPSKSRRGDLWMELARAPIGVPAVAARIDPGAAQAQFPDACFRHCPPGDYWLRIIDESGQELDTNAFRREGRPISRPAGTDRSDEASSGKRRSSVAAVLNPPCSVAELAEILDASVPTAPGNSLLLAGSPGGPLSRVDSQQRASTASPDVEEGNEQGAFDRVVLEVDSPGDDRIFEALRRAIEPSGVAVVLVSVGSTFSLIPPAKETTYRWVIRASHEQGLFVESERVVQDDHGQPRWRLLLMRRAAFRVRPFDEADLPGLLDLFLRVFHVPRPASHVEWKFLDNPFGPLTVSVTTSEAGVPAGQYAGYPVPYVRVGADGRTVSRFRALQVGDTMTEPAFRDIGSGATKVLVRTVRHFFATYRSSDIGFYFGFNRGGIQRFSAQVIGGDIIEDVPFWSARRERITAVATQPPASDDLRAVRVDAVDGAFDDLFDRVCGAYVFLAERKRDYLRWRYSKRPDVDYVILRVDRAAHMIGWGIFRRHEDGMLWVDTLTEPQYAAAVMQALLEAAWDCPELRDADRVEGWFPSRPAFLAPALESAGLTRAEEPNGLSMLWLGDAIPTADVMRREFYYTMGDSDLF